MEIEWAAWYRPAWDERPDQYVEAGVVAWGKSRRLAKARDERLDVKAFIGVQHFDPGRWNLPGEPSVRFFLSVFVHSRTVSLRTYPTIAAALAALASFQVTLRAQHERQAK
jgi:hypothetical protein